MIIPAFTVAASSLPSIGFLVRYNHLFFALCRSPFLEVAGEELHQHMQQVQEIVYHRATF